MLFCFFSTANLTVSAASQYQLYWPVPTSSASIGRYSSAFGPRKAPTSGASTNHRGIDIPVKSGTAVYAAYDGIVMAVSKSNLRGNYVLIYHSAIGLSTLYQHLTSATVQKGDNVSGGSQIAISGNTGVGTGAHLHFGVMVGKATKADNDQVGYNMAIDPLGSNISYTASGGTIKINSDNPDDYTYPTRDLFYTSPVKTGNDVKWVQAVLLKLGYEIAIDGSFGPITRDVVKQFQQDKNLTVDGSCGPATRSKLLDCWNAKKNGSIPITLHTWLSNNEYGEIPNEYVAGDWLYLNYKLFDRDTMCGIDSEITKTYSVLVEIYGPDGKLENSSTFDNDNSWIAIRRYKSGTYTGKVTVTGEVVVNGSVACNVVYNCTLQASSTSVSLNLNGTNTASIKFTPTGGYPGSRGVDWSGENGIVAASSGGWSSDSSYFTLNLKGLKNGTTDLKVWLYENYTGNKVEVATTTIHIIVTANSYTISFNANGGSGAPSSQTKYYGTDIVLSSITPTRSGYTFLGWSTNSSATSATYQPGSTYTSNTSATLYAVWKANTYTITYNANGGTGAPSAQTKNAGETITLTSQIPIRTGYNFLAWCDNSEVTGENYIECITGTREGSIFLSGEYYSTDKNITLYAVWEKQSYSISYNANGGSGAPSSQTKYYGTNIALSSTVPTRTGYTFLGWATSSYATSAAYEPGETYTGNSSITLYAVWEAKGYSVLFDANGGSGAPTQQIKIHDQPLTLSSTKPTRSGYTFLGWSTSNSATSAMYQPGGSYTVNSATMLFAVWKEDTVLSSISVYCKPSKTVYYIGDTFNTVGLQLKLIYSDGSYEIISSGFTTSGFSSTSAGTKAITVSYGGKSVTFSVTVISPTITLSLSSKDMNIGETATLTAATTPTGQAVTWTSSDTSVATVSNGIITAKAAGTAIITAKFTYNGIVYSNTCTVTVKENVLIGDVNGDGIVNGKDGVLLAQYLAEWDVTVVDAAADCNGDGIINGKDGVLLAQYLAEWDVTLG